jgi:hypothetical protein
MAWDTASRLRGAAFRTWPLSLAKSRIEIGRIFRKEQKPGAGGLDRLADRLSFVRSEIVENDDVVRLESGDQELLDIGAKALAVDRA